MNFYNSLSDEHKELLLTWISEERTPIFIKSEFKKLGIKATLKSIREIYELKRGKKNRDDGIEEKVIEVKSNPVVLGLDSLLERFNIPTNLDDSENVIEAVQKFTQQIFLLESAIRFTALEEHASGMRSYPSESVKGYKATFDALSAAMSLKDHVSLPAAIRTIESEGYALEIIEEKE